MIRSDKTCSLALIVLAVLFAAAGTLAGQQTSPSAAPKQTAPPAAKSLAYRSRSAPALTRRAHIVLACAEGHDNQTPVAA